MRQAQNEKSTEHLERQASQLQALKADLEAQSAASGGDEPNQQQLETLQRQSIELAAQLDATQEQARQAEQRAEEARQLLEQAQAELLERRATQAAAAQDDDAGISSEAIDEIAELTAQLGQVREELSRRGEDASDDPNMARRVSDLEQERTALESELELVRGRAAELSETAAAQQRAIAAERAEWADELKQMRKALERQTQTVANAETQVHAQGASGPGYAPRGSGPPPAQAAPPDAVLESIRAQFEQVQRDRARRRDHDAANGSKNVAVL